MPIRQILSDFELAIMLTQKRVHDLALDRAFILADMAVRGIYPDERFNEQECELWSKYRFILGGYADPDWIKTEL